jgi:hypothetical protein
MREGCIASDPSERTRLSQPIQLSTKLDDAMTHRRTLGILFLIAIVTTNALACSCIQIGGADPIAAVGGTDAVFRASVVKSEAVLANDDGAILRSGQRETATGYVQQLIVLRIEEVFKGEVAPLAILITGSGVGDCGYTFEEGKEYLVFASFSSEKRLTALARSAPVLTTSICSFTRAAEGASELLISLRTKFPPKQPVWVTWPE